MKFMLSHEPSLLVVLIISLLNQHLKSLVPHHQKRRFVSTLLLPSLHSSDL